MRIRPPRQKNDKTSRDGQAAILLAIMISSFLMFFVFAVNTGLLINAKISVQTAADAAAYAGAAVQARQLNAISFLNYDMRRQFKKFLFRYGYVSSIGSPQFPNAPGISGVDSYDFPKLDFAPPATSAGARVKIKVPIVCIPISGSASIANDTCMSINYRNTAYDVQSVVGPIGGLNAISQAYLNSVVSIATVANELCTGRSGVNVFTALAWLFRGDLKDSTIKDLLDKVMNQPGVTAAQRQEVMKRVEPLIKGLGLYPRNLIHLMRIDTQKEFINEKPANVTGDEVQALEAKAGADAHERTILAFKSAQGNLNSAVFDVEKTRLEELQPAKMLELDEVKATFNVYVQAMTKTTVAPTVNSPTACESLVYTIPANQAPVGVRLASGSGKKVFYAIRLRTYVKPRGLLFMQGSEGLELDAMAAAKPFGSRIGPGNLDATNFVVEKKPDAKINGKDVCTNNCFSPNLAVGGGSTFYSINFLKEMHTMSGGANPDTAKMLEAQRHALAPNPGEVGHYNILPPNPGNTGGQDPMDFEFIPYTDSKSAQQTDTQVYRFYAPVFPKDGNSVNAKIDQFLDGIFQSVSVGTNEIGLDIPTLKSQLGAALKSYVGGSPLANGGDLESENQETETFAALDLPMFGLTQSRDYWINQGKEVRTSWSPDHHKVSAYDVRFTPRFGYSVKLVAFRDLMRQGLSADDPDAEKLSH